MLSMSVYAIFGSPTPADVDARVQALFPNRLQLGAGQWLVAYQASLPSDVYQAMKNMGGDLKCIVTPVAGYYGWHDKAIWDWIASRGT